jgi:hypothetical protein
VSWFEQQYEREPCDRWCPLGACQTCAFRGGDFFGAQQDSARETAPRCADSGVASGKLGHEQKSAPGRCVNTSEGLALTRLQDVTEEESVPTQKSSAPQSTTRHNTQNGSVR